MLRFFYTHPIHKARDIKEVSGDVCLRPIIYDMIRPVLQYVFGDPFYDFALSDRTRRPTGEATFRKCTLTVYSILYVAATNRRTRRQDITFVCQTRLRGLAIIFRRVVKSDQIEL